MNGNFCDWELEGTALKWMEMNGEGVTNSVGADGELPVEPIDMGAGDADCIIGAGWTDGVCGAGEPVVVCRAEEDCVWGDDWIWAEEAASGITYGVAE